jgi:quercetin dioxygenase-like cupin family protein
MRAPIVPTAEGVTRQVLAQNPALMLVEFRFATGAIGARHQHPHVQASYVQSGRFRFTRGDEVVDLAAGDSLMIAAHQPHGCLCLEAGVLIDSFAPMREDFL